MEGGGEEGRIEEMRLGKLLSNVKGVFLEERETHLWVS